MGLNAEGAFILAQCNKIVVTGQVESRRHWAGPGFLDRKMYSRSNRVGPDVPARRGGKLSIPESEMHDEQEEHVLDDGSRMSTCRLGRYYTYVRCRPELVVLDALLCSDEKMLLQ